MKAVQPTANDVPLSNASPTVLLLVARAISIFFVTQNSINLLNAFQSRQRYYQDYYLVTQAQRKIHIH